MISSEARKKMGWSKGMTFPRSRFKKHCKICNKLFETVPTSKKQFTCSRKCQFIRLRKYPQNRICNFCKNSYQAKKKNSKFCSRKCAIKWYYSDKPKKIKPSDIIPRYK